MSSSSDATAAAAAPPPPAATISDDNVPTTTTTTTTTTTDSTGTAKSRSPAAFLTTITGRPVTVKLTSGVLYKGNLSCLDGYMNIALEQTVEWIDGRPVREYGDAFLRGNNVLYISTTRSS